MAVYKIVAPCAYVQDGKAVHHKHPGKVVRLDDAVADELGDSVELVEADSIEAGDAPAEFGEDDDDLA